MRDEAQETQAGREVRATLCPPAPRPYGLTLPGVETQVNLAFVAPPVSESSSSATLATGIRMMAGVCHSPAIRPTQEKPVLHFNVGEVVERRELSTTTRGTVVHVTANGYVVTVQWYGWFGLEGRESTHRSDELVRVAD